MRRWLVEMFDDVVHPMRCSWCRKPARQARKLITGPMGLMVCNDCVLVMHDILQDA